MVEEPPPIRDDVRRSGDVSDVRYNDGSAQREFDFWLNQLNDEHPSSPHVVLAPSDVLRAHFHLIDYFSEQGVLLGGIGPRDLNLFQSTIFRQFSGYGGHEKWDNQFLIIATLFFGIVRNHPFHDANKRTALLSMLYHLELIGKCMTLSDEELEDFTVDLADRKLERHRRRRNRRKRLRDADAEVSFVARWIRRNSRNVDNDYRDISYIKLRAILNKYEFDIVNPSANHIDLVKIEEKRGGILRIGAKRTVATRVRRIGFHSWKSTVPKGVMKVVRESAGLTFDRGIDSQVFYNTADPIAYLIGRYETPLRNLANR
jgi:death-on-curing family protein